MAYIQVDDRIDGQDVGYWHKQYIERRDRVDQLEAENEALRDKVKRQKRIINVYRQE